MVLLLPHTLVEVEEDSGGVSWGKDRGNRLQETLTQATRVHDRDNQRREEQNMGGLHRPVQQCPKEQVP